MEEVIVTESDPLNAAIDISHHSASPDFQQAATTGIVGVIRKATHEPVEGTRFPHTLGTLYFGVGGNGRFNFLLPTKEPGTRAVRYPGMIS